MIKLPHLNSQTDAQSATIHHYTDATAPNTSDAEPGSAPAPAPAQPPPPNPATAGEGENENSQPVTPNVVGRQPATLPSAFAALDARRSTLDLLAPSAALSLSVIETQPLAPTAPVARPLAALDPRPSTPDLSPAPSAQRRYRRHGRVASLPKIQRDMVNRMLWNGVPYKNIVVALEDAGFTVVERNISSWATGGYLEWRLEQEAVLENRLNQDHLLDFLRRDDAPELPEVGLQAAATRLSQVLLQKLARADDPELNLGNYTQLVDLLCRLNREITATQKQRDDSRRTLGKDYDPVLVKDVEQVNAIEKERYYSNPDSDSDLKKPAVPPLLPQIPTATFLADQTREEKADAEHARALHTAAMMKALLAKTAKPTTKEPA